MVCPGCRHWTQQERPDEGLNAAMIDFLRSLPDQG